MSYREFVLAHLGPFDDVEDLLLLATLGMAGEVGEVVDIVKKARFHNHPPWQDQYLDELGDVYFYFTLFLMAQGYTLEEVIAHNRKKLDERYPDGFDAERSANR